MGDLFAGCSRIPTSVVAQVKITRFWEVVAIIWKHSDSYADGFDEPGTNNRGQPFLQFIVFVNNVIFLC